MGTQVLTYRYRVKDKHAARLNKTANAVNFLWNFCNDTQRHALKWDKRWPSGYALEKLTAGSYKLLGLHTNTISAVCAKYYESRRAKNRPYLRYRGKKNLGWIPFRGRNVRFIDNKFSFAKIKYEIWFSRTLPKGAKICDGCSFSQDSKGRWYLNVVIEIPARNVQSDKAIGIDIGLKSLASLSTGEVIEAPRLYRKTERKLTTAQRAGKKRQLTKIHAKIANQRKDFLHKASTLLAKEYGHIIVGNVSASKLAKTKMAKSVHDAGWSDFRNMLRYKAIGRGGMYEEVDEAYTTVTCSGCFARSGPKGHKGLRIREWVCNECGAVHDRDHNSAKLILRRGHSAPIEGAAA